MTFSTRLFTFALFLPLAAGAQTCVTSTCTAATNSTVLINTGAANNGTQQFSYLIFSNTASTKASGIQQQSGHGTNQAWKFTGDKFSGFTTAIDSSDGTPDDVAFITLDGTEVTDSTAAGINFSNAGPVTINSQCVLKLA